MNILLLGNGGRENAIAAKIEQSTKKDMLFVSPGNTGMSSFAINIDLGNNLSTIKEFVLKQNIKMLVVGPEQPLVAGIADFFAEDKELKDVILIAPSKQGAMLEGSKDFAKRFMQRHNIPTSRYETFTKDTVESAKSFLRTLHPPYVLKADGLAAGKGVLIINNLVEAEQELQTMLFENKFGNASNKVVIEQFLSGIECSVFVLTDGKNYKILPEAKDYKRIGEGDTGLNTGGMGSVSPVRFADKDFMNKVEERIVQPTITGLQQEQIDYKGFIFIGLMNVEGEPYVIEYNVRMGDPETEVVFPRIKSDIVEAFEAVGKGELDKYVLEIDNRFAACVMMVSKGYPEHYEKGKIITGLNCVKDCMVFHAGTKYAGKDLITDGGRVLAITCSGDTLEEALANCYRNVECISFDGAYYRRDIGQDLM
ncbi:MAG: phosphoribosylamine--glycine ligase [Bacteroidales bacterium]|jgi:phosphoribosylamine--glycine ligase|nr:phosphoribosylamine--glycine ligase [Bacteroidales bacterium]